MQRKIILFQNWFNSEKRHDEYLKSIIMNDDNSMIDKIVLFCNDDHGDLKQLSSKVKIVPIAKQPTYEDYIEYANTKFKNCICIIANLDIYFTDTVKYVRDYVDNDTAMALTRHEYFADGKHHVVENAYGCQDAWAFKSPCNTANMKLDFHLGIGGCDHRIAFEFDKNYNVVNPCYKIYSIHTHKTAHRPWQTKKVLPAKDGYKFVHPHGKEYISFSLFSPRKLQRHRSWDDCNANKQRYLYNIPAIVAVYNHIYPTFKLKFSMSADAQLSMFFNFMKAMADKDLLEYELVGIPYTNTEPTIWRYNPLFNQTIDTLFIRDVDSLPTRNELAANLKFMQSKVKMCTIKSHINHNKQSSCKLLAGLIGFNPHNISTINNFAGYYHRYANGEWGCDQRAIINYTEKVLKIAGSDVITFPFNIPKLDKKFTYTDSIVDRSLKAQIASINETVNVELLDLLDDITEWEGCPIDTRGETLDKILDLTSTSGKIVRQILEENGFESFYDL